MLCLMMLFILSWTLSPSKLRKLYLYSCLLCVSANPGIFCIFTNQGHNKYLWFCSPWAGRCRRASWGSCWSWSCRTRSRTARRPWSDLPWCICICMWIYICIRICVYILILICILISICVCWATKLIWKQLVIHDI